MTDLARRLVVRSLGVVTTLAVVSLWVQIDGLIGSRGILPVALAVPADPWRAPSIVWLWPSDAMLHGLCALGVALGLFVASGRGVAGPALLALWAVYLSLGNAGQIFLGYQWDTLLCETLLVVACIARWDPRTERRASPLGVWLVRLTLFKLMLDSGLVKLTSGDGTWRDGTALAYHYWTQPIPNPLSWYAHHLPARWHTVETYATLLIEIALPFAMFMGRWGRRAAFVGFSVVLGALFVTGNYGFFQLLSMVLVLSLLDDADLGSEPLAEPATRATNALVGTVLAVFLAVGAAMSYGRVLDYRDLPEPALAVVRAAHPWRTINAYGLFANMTEDRPELVIEGSDDGETWTPYVFRYKPGPLDRTPPVVAPHMPRLDWQLWFAALRSCERAPWVPRLLARLQAREPAVMGLIANDPFPDGGPRYIRANRVRYAFTDAGADTWRTLGPTQPYCPVRTR
ncbi:MAG: lipase maturation factor family protein [Myxococcales bacterium]|nr:lipase maturation factor family protein [Myxococcales bacterium]